MGRDRRLGTSPSAADKSRPVSWSWTAATPAALQRLGAVCFRDTGVADPHVS